MSEAGSLYGVLHLTEEQREARAKRDARLALEKQQKEARAAVRNRHAPYGEARTAHVDGRSASMARPKRVAGEPALGVGRRDRQGVYAARGREDEVEHVQHRTSLGEMIGARDRAKLRSLKSR